MEKAWLYGHELMRECQITDTTLLQWLLDGLPAYSPNSLRKIEKHVFEREGLTAFCEWKTATSFRTYSVEGVRTRLRGLIFRRPDIEAAAAGLITDTHQTEQPQRGTPAPLVRKYGRKRWVCIDWTMVKGWARRGNCLIVRVLGRF